MPLPLLPIIGAAAAGIVKSQIDKSKETKAFMDEAEAKCAEEAKTYKIQKEKTELQQKMQDVLLKYAFSEFDKKEKPPMSDWGHLSEETQICAARNKSLIGWGEYSFFTEKAIYYHHKRKAIHDFLYYDGINDYDADTGIVDYGSEHEKRDISQWSNFEKKFVEQISRIWKMEDETDVSILEFCFNNCDEFQKNLRYFKTDEIKNAFENECKKHRRPTVLCENFSQIKIVSIEDGKMTLQFWEYFPKVQNVVYNEDDSDEEIWEKDREQEEREREAEERQRKAMNAFEQLVKMENTIAILFQQSLYNLFGVMFKQIDITFLEEPDFSFGGESFIDRLENTANSAKAFVYDYADKHNLNQ